MTALHPAQLHAGDLLHFGLPAMRPFHVIRVVADGVGSHLGWLEIPPLLPGVVGTVAVVVAEMRSPLHYPADAWLNVDRDCVTHGVPVGDDGRCGECPTDVDPTPMYSPTDQT